ncbi:MAG TPA: superoxide dismutase [Gemmatimonadaceae bacterium]
MMARYVLPELRYDYSALEPHISARVMELHHGKHHAAYVKNANAALERLDEALGKGDFQSVVHLERTLAFNLSGHMLHSIFWQSMGPDGSEEPGGDLQRVIERDFGSFDRFRRLMNEVAASIMGSGWAALVWEPASARLLVAQIYDHQSNVVQCGIPIMVIDAWEHAYYLQYENRKSEFFDSLWNVWNWSDIAGRFDAVRGTAVGLRGAADAA